MSQIGALRNYYRQMIAALPWLDGWRLDEEFAAPFEYKCDLSHFPAPEKGKISLWQQECGDLSDFMRQRFSEGKIPAVRHDQITNTELVAALKSNAQIPLILGSGDKKLIYFILGMHLTEVHTIPCGS